jgi:hypothetical protein
MFMSTWADSAGFNPGWTNSESYHATSNSVLGPYTRKGYVWSSGSHHGHNTSAVELPDGTYAVIVSEVVPFTIYHVKLARRSLDSLSQLERRAHPNQRPQQLRRWPLGLQRQPLPALRRQVRNRAAPRDHRHRGHRVRSLQGAEAHVDLSRGQYPDLRHQRLPEADLDTRRIQSDLYLGRRSHIWRSGGTYHVIYSGSGDRVGWHVYSSDGLTNWKDGGYAWSPRDYQKIFCYEGSTTCNQWYKMERPAWFWKTATPPISPGPWPTWTRTTRSRAAPTTVARSSWCPSTA